MVKKKLLIIRFSSFGDIIQALGSSKFVKDSGEFEVHWLTKEQFGALVSLSPHVDRVLTLPNNATIFDLIKLTLSLRKEGYTHIFDAHMNIRAHIFSFVFRLFNFSSYQFIRRSKHRLKRILLFKFRINYFPRPFKGMHSFVLPLSGFSDFRQLNYESIDLRQNLSFESLVDESKVREVFDFSKSYIAIAPSAAWGMKTWPKEHWHKLISGIRKESDIPCVVLGGPQDTFCQEFENQYDNVINLAGKLSLVESSFIVKQSKCLISADTGLLHVADLLGVNCLALIGPTAFGFPSHSNVKTLEVELECRPCTKDGRGNCSQKIYQKCMVDIRPEIVQDNLFQRIKN